MPALTAASNIGPDRRVSRPTNSRAGSSPPSTCAAARPTARANSGVRSTFAGPGIPSVPNHVLDKTNLHEGRRPSRHQSRVTGHHLHEVSRTHVGTPGIDACYQI